jgi:hypothetical protein
LVLDLEMIIEGERENIDSSGWRGWEWKDKKDEKE